MHSSRHTLALLITAGVALAPLAAAAQATPAAPSAQPAPAADTDTIRLTDEQRLAILDHNTPESVAAARGEMPEAERKTLGIHGEVGAAIGTNGLRSLYGVAQVPLGDNAAATVAFESSQYGYPRRGR
ncbi:hypothetical protein [Sphingomonas sp. PAMC 26605]|uniref:hypothetical protein n=1 Tax=Sphingomonas sp. PAMC 26605 TaxID=1112214 RepID=UPI00026CAC1C|nr:hypothetical protein [Sphingomonas sp. PAMC 26605]